MCIRDRFRLMICRFWCMVFRFYISWFRCMIFGFYISRFRCRRRIGGFRGRDICWFRSRYISWFRCRIGRFRYVVIVEHMKSSKGCTMMIWSGFMIGRFRSMVSGFYISRFRSRYICRFRSRMRWVSRLWGIWVIGMVVINRGSIGIKGCYGDYGGNCMFRNV